MASYSNEYNFAMSGSATNAQRLACAIVDYASSVVATEGTAVTGHTQRMAFATAAVQNPDATAREMILAVVVVLGSAGNTNPTDADLKTTVGALWNLFSGVG